MRARLLFCLSALLVPFLSGANAVSGLNASYKNGQVFCTWQNLPALGIQYRLYKSPLPIVHGADLATAEYLGSVRDSSSFNKRLSEVQLQPLYLRIDSASAALDSNTGLFVTTTEQNGDFYYALTTVIAGVEDTSINFGENSLSVPVSEIVDRPKPVYQFTKNVNNHFVYVYVLFTSLTSTSLFPHMVNVGSYPFNFAIYKNGTVPPHPLTIRLSGGGSNFMSGIVSGALPNEYRIGLDDWIPNDERTTWFGYNEAYDIYSHHNPPPVTGINYDYALQRLEYVIDWAIRNLDVDSNSVYFSGVSSGAAGSFFASLTYPDRIAAASLNVPKFDLSFLHDPDTTNNYNEGKPGRLRVDTLCGTVPVNLFTNSGVHTYDLLNGGWLAHEHANDNVPVLFAVNGKRDTMVGWAEKIPYYDSVNANHLGGFYFWDLRKHNGDGLSWIFAPNVFRYHRNVSFPAFSNCSVNNNPGDGHADSGDSIGTINGFLDWNDTITDDTDHYVIDVFMHDLATYFYNVPAPDSCFADVTIRRLQNFHMMPGWLVVWQNTHHGEVVQLDSFLYTGGLITLPQVKIFKDTNEIKVTYAIPTSIASAPNAAAEDFKLFPNPATNQITVSISSSNSKHSTVVITDVMGKEWYRFTSGNPETNLPATLDVHRFPAGIYFVNVDGKVKSFSRQ